MLTISFPCRTFRDLHKWSSFQLIWDWLVCCYVEQVQRLMHVLEQHQISRQVVPSGVSASQSRYVPTLLSSLTGRNISNPLRYVHYTHLMLCIALYSLILLPRRPVAPLRCCRTIPILFYWARGGWSQFYWIRSIANQCFAILRNQAKNRPWLHIFMRLLTVCSI